MKDGRCVCPPKPGKTGRTRTDGAIAVVLYRAVRSRCRRATALACWLAVALAAPVASAQSTDGLIFRLPRELSSQEPRLKQTLIAARQLLSDWFGSPGSGALTVEGVSWRAGRTPVDRPGFVVVPLRWLAPVRDQSNQRALVVAVATQYWLGDAASRPFRDALVVYTAARAIHHLLEGSNFAAPRFFDDHAPFPLRSVLFSPPVGDPRPRVWRFEALPINDAAILSHNVRALQTIERYVGWPTMLETLAALRAAGPSQLNPESLGVQLSEIRGTDMRGLVWECFRPDATFDYALATLASRPGAGDLFETTVTLVRPGTGRFILREERGDPTLSVTVRFADGTEVYDRFDAAAPSVTLTYAARTRAVSAIVDDEAMLLLDVNRDNNAIVRDAPTLKLGVRLALHWLGWLQNAMLSYTALL